MRSSLNIVGILSANFVALTEKQKEASMVACIPNELEVLRNTYDAFRSSTQPVLVS